MFEIIIKTDNPAVLEAIAKAVKNVPPDGFETSGTPVNVNASLKDMKAATEAVNLNPGETVEPVVIPEDVPTPAATPPATTPPAATPPATTPPAATDEEARNARRAKLRQLVTAAGQKMEAGIPGAMAEALKISTVKQAKDLPDCDNFNEVCKALEAMAS